jgi:hypothetical protein
MTAIHEPIPAQIPMQVGSVLRIKNSGEIMVSNPELELARDPDAADAVLLYYFDPVSNEHIIRLQEPVADHKHIRHHSRDA